MNCPHCGKQINPAAMLGSISTPAKARASRENAKLGGWPKGKPRKPKRKPRRPNPSPNITMKPQTPISPMNTPHTPTPMNTAHTPGPWIVDATPEHCPCRFIVRAKGNKCDAWVPLADCSGHHDSQANAALIASAPTLLAQRNQLREALATLEPIARRCGGEHPRHDTLNAACALARAALARTEGV